MATFYLLPPRPALGEHVAKTLQRLFPGLTWEESGWSQLADSLTAAVTSRADIHVVHREDLPEGEDPAQALADGFGAEPGDEIIEVLPL